MADKLESIKHAWNQLQTARDGSYAERALPPALAEEVGYLLSRLEAAERYIESDIAYDTSVRHAEYFDAVAARDAREKALERWVAAKE